MDLKCWIRIRIETNTDAQACLPGPQLWIRSSVKPNMIAQGSGQLWAGVSSSTCPASLWPSPSSTSTGSPSPTLVGHLSLPGLWNFSTIVNYRYIPWKPGLWNADQHRLHADPDPTCYFDADLFLIYHFDVIWSWIQTLKMKDVKFWRSTGLPVWNCVGRFKYNFVQIHCHCLRRIKNTTRSLGLANNTDRRKLNFEIGLATYTDQSYGNGCL